MLSRRLPSWQGDSDDVRAVNAVVGLMPGRVGPFAPRLLCVLGRGRGLSSVVYEWLAVAVQKVEGSGVVGVPRCTDFDGDGVGEQLWSACLRDAACDRALGGWYFAFDRVSPEVAARVVVEVAGPPRPVGDGDVRCELAAEVGLRDLAC